MARPSVRSAKAGVERIRNICRVRSAITFWCYVVFAWVVGLSAVGTAVYLVLTHTDAALAFFGVACVVGPGIPIAIYFKIVQRNYFNDVILLEMVCLVLDCSAQVFSGSDDGADDSVMKAFKDLIVWLFESVSSRPLPANHFNGPFNQPMIPNDVLSMMSAVTKQAQQDDSHSG